MTFYAFRLLSPVMQRSLVLKHGTFLAQYWDEEDVNFYYYTGKYYGGGSFNSAGRHPKQG